MTCAELERDLALHAAGLVAGERAQALREHLASCPGCQGRLSEFRELDRRLAAQSVRADDALVSRVLAEVAATDVLRGLRRRMLIQGLAPILVLLSMLAWLPVAISGVRQFALQWAPSASAGWHVLALPEQVALTALGLSLVAVVTTLLTGRLAQALT